MYTIRRLPFVLAIATAACSCGGSGGADAVNGPTPPPQAPLPSTLTGKIVFIRVEGMTNTLMAMNPDGSAITSLRANGFSAHVSPDGRKVAYNNPGDGISVLDLSTGKESVVAPALSIKPRWSPDGGKILFWSDRSGTKELYTMSPDGSAVVRVTDGGNGYHEGDWSPDGSRIVFRRVTGDGGDIWTMNADGTGAALLYAGDRMDSDPRWSPDGRRIAFVSSVPRARGGYSTEIYVIGADGSNLVRATRHDGEDWSPAWSPDGSRIAFFGFRITPTDSDLFTVNPDGTGLSALLEGPAYDHGPVFGPRQ